MDVLLLWVSCVVR